jgi:hypothetical protein
MWVDVLEVVEIGVVLVLELVLIGAAALKLTWLWELRKSERDSRRQIGEIKEMLEQIVKDQGGQHD